MIESALVAAMVQGNSVMFGRCSDSPKGYQQMRIGRTINWSTIFLVVQKFVVTPSMSSTFVDR